MANSSISILTLLINQFEHINTHIIHCVCGEYLHKVYDASILYAGSGAACDFCGAIGAKNDVFWHCTQESRLFHANGFDICDKCAISHDHKSNELLNSPIYLSNSNLCAIQTNMIQCTEQTQCKSLQNILLLLQNYSDVEHIPGVSNQQLLQIVNDYLHVLLQHDTDQHFKYGFMINAEYTTCRVRFIFHLEYLLSLLVYCNFTHLQQLFSKTYRENDGQDHEQFYFMGRNLKISVLKFGAKVSESRVHKFYHGVDQKLFMPHYTGYRGGIDVHGPLSTSSSFAVAMHFTDNQGLLLQFGPPLMSTSKYFATSWLSDFPHEREYLFIQNQTLVIDNIIEPSAEMEYGVLLKAVKCIGFLKNSDFNVVNYVEHTQYNVVTEIDPSMQELIRTICHHQLSKTNADFEAIESITPLATHILDTFFNTRDFTVYVDHVH
eukprot:513948_1